jgi:hypothetical protein
MRSAFFAAAASDCDLPQDWQPLPFTESAVNDQLQPDTDPVMFCEGADGTVHIQGRLSFAHQAPANDGDYMHVATLPPHARPAAEGMLWEVAKVGVWGDARVRIRCDGEMHVKPAHSMYMPISFAAAAPELPELMMGDWQPLPYTAEFAPQLKPDADPVLFRVGAGGVVHIQGRLSLARDTNGGNYVHVATLPPGARPRAQDKNGMLWEVAKVGVWGDARVEIRSNGEVHLKPAHSVYMPIMFAADSVKPTKSAAKVGAAAVLSSSAAPEGAGGITCDPATHCDGVSELTGAGAAAT